MRLIMTNELFLSKIQEKFGDRYLILDDFVNLKYKIKVKCNRCENEFITTPSSLLYENHVDWCCVCKKEKVRQDFIKRLKDTCGDEYIALSEYNNCKEKVLFKHNIGSCGNEFWMTPDTFFNGDSRCPICMHRQGADKLFVSNDIFKERIDNIHNGHIIVNSKYHGGENKVNITHVDCGRTFDVLAGDLLQGKGCRYCAGKMLKTQEQFEQDINEKYDGEYSVLGEYINAKTKVLIRHNICGYEWDIVPTTILKRRTCPHCNKSYGEFDIENFCIFNNIKYETQYIFKDCKYKDYLKYDIAIFNNEGLLKCIIEYDGIGHFEPVQFGGISLEQAEENLRENKIRDKIKTDYCGNNNIPLLRIKYTEEKFIERLIIPFLYNLFNIEYNIPNKYMIKHLKKNNVKLLELLLKLPNGLYPKEFIKDKITDKNIILSNLFKDEVIKNYTLDNNISISKSFVEINKKDNYDFDRYYKIGVESNFNFPAFRFINKTINLKNGNYEKGNLNLTTDKYTHLDYVFMKTYMDVYGILNQQRYIKVNNYVHKRSSLTATSFIV